MSGLLENFAGGNLVLIALLLLPVAFQVTVSVLYWIAEALNKRRGAL